MADGSNAYYELMCSKMLEAREKHARHQEKDYSHVFRKKTFSEILRLSALAVGVGFVYAAETAFVSPTLLQVGIDRSKMTMVWALSPILGLLLGPLLGSISDRCRLSWGRRRPMILLLSLGIAIGFICLPFGRNIGHFFGDDTISALERNGTSIETTTNLAVSIPNPNLKITVILTILGTMIMDFSAETCQSPARAYMLDVCIPEDHSKVLSFFSVMAGLGSAVAYGIGGINWESTALAKFFGGNIQTAFMIDAFFFLVCFLITILSFREIPLSLMEKDKMLQPLVFTAVKADNAPKPAIVDDFCMESQNYRGENFAVSDSYISSINANSETVSLGTYLRSIVVMPKSMWILSLTNLLCWMGHICYCVYFTDYVGEKVFHGNPTAPATSVEYKLYENGIRFGGLGMALYALSCSFYSLIIEKLMERFKAKYVYIFGIIVFAVGMFVIAAWPSKLGVVFISITAGIIYGTVYTIPFIIVANYHAKGCFEIRDGQNVPLKKTRGLGTDIAIISSMLFIAQLIISLGIGFFVTWMGTTSATFYAGSVFSICAAVSAMFVLYI